MLQSLLAWRRFRSPEATKHYRKAVFPMNCFTFTFTYTHMIDRGKVKRIEGEDGSLEPAHGEQRHACLPQIENKVAGKQLCSGPSKSLAAYYTWIVWVWVCMLIQIQGIQASATREGAVRRMLCDTAISNPGFPCSNGFLL